MINFIFYFVLCFKKILWKYGKTVFEKKYLQISNKIN